MVKIAISFVSILTILSVRADAQGPPGSGRIDTIAQFPGGIEEFYNHVKSNLNYPVTAVRDSITGTVLVEFVIDKDGNVKSESVRVVQGLYGDCDVEAIRVIKASPAWIPARSLEKPVQQLVKFPVCFSFSKD